MPGGGTGGVSPRCLDFQLGDAQLRRLPSPRRSGDNPGAGATGRDRGLPLNEPTATVTLGRRGRIVATATVLLAAAILTASVIAATGAFHPPTAAAAAPLCRNVAAQSGINYRGAYGVTPGALSPMMSVMLRNMGNGAAVADTTGSGNLDVLLLGQQGHPNRFFRNHGATAQPQFEDETDAAGLRNIGGSRVAAFADLDNDGHPDLLVINDWDGTQAGTPSRVFRNKGDGTFADATDGSGFAPVGYIVGGLGLADFNHDGLLDLYITYWTLELGGDPSRPSVIRGQFPGHNVLYENLGNFRFRDVTADVGLGEIGEDSFTPIFADFTGDGWPDIYVAIDHRPDLFFVNDHGAFRDASKEFGLTHTGNDMGVAAADLTGDGLIDIYATNISDPNRQFGNSQGNTLMVGQRDANGRITYTDHAPALGIADSGWGWGTAFTDLNLDGNLDLYAAQGMQEFIGATSPELRNQKARLFLNTGGGGFALAGPNGCDIPGDQRAVIPLDFNRDGAPDLLVTQVGWSTQLLQNTTTGRGWLTIDVSRAGAQAAGARVTVTAGGRRTTQLALYGGSYLAGMPMELYFGLADAKSADDVTITWADGTTSDLGPVPSGRLLHATPAGIQP